ncbi:hypothetical protein VT84_11435 [Gemmata sp. SH-PL17]|nr:hypothetical protein VT84_11435 [Gemmata sp. SH-PL17]
MCRMAEPRGMGKGQPEIAPFELEGGFIAMW